MELPVLALACDRQRKDEDDTVCGKDPTAVECRLLLVSVRYGMLPESVFWFQGV